MTALPLLRDNPFVPMPLRPHQARTIEMLRASLATGVSRIVVELATGAGKTRLAAEITNLCLDRGNKVAFTVPALSLIDQTVEAFESQGIDFLGVQQANHPRTHFGAPVQICSVQTMARRQFPDANVVIVDECHQQFQTIKDWMAERPDTVFIGLSATPWAKGMADDWQAKIKPIGMQDLIDAGYLSPFKVFAPSHPDLSGVRTVRGDYDVDQLSDAMSDKTLVADVVDTWLRRASGRPTLVFAVDRAHARHLQRQFERAGVPMGYCDAYTDRLERQQLFDQLARGLIKGICNVGTLTTGVDADIRCIVMARPTKSEMLFVQCIGRGLRTAPGKDHCLILDHADNHARLGFVTDIEHEVLLTGSDQSLSSRSERGEPMPKECSSCGTLKPPKTHTCPSCGFKPERQSEVEIEDGELVEIKRTVSKPTKDDKQRFWSMALWLDCERSKGGRLAKALYKQKFGVWPRGLIPRSVRPDGEFFAYERSRRIAYAKSKGAHR